MESLLGVSGNQVFVYPASELAVIVSEHNPEEALNQKSGVDHARVIADCFQHSTVLPFRFGTVFHDDESLRKSIRSNQRQFLGHIDKLRGKSEMHLKILVGDCSGHGAGKRPQGDGANREYQMQLSGPWPPYHFVHRLTCGAHSHAQQPSAVAMPVIHIPEPASMVV